MYKVLFVIPSLEYGGAAKQACLLAAGLPRDQFTVKVCAFRDDGPLVKTLLDARVEVEALGWERPFDVRPLIRLRSVARAYRPDLIHTVGLPALRTLLLTASRNGSKLVADALLNQQRHAGPNWFDRRLLNRVDCFMVSSAGEAERCRPAGIPAPKTALVPRGVATGGPGKTTSSEVRRSLGIPESARLLAGVGPLEPYKGYRDAIWALDILRQLYSDLHLLLIGTGSDRPHLERFAHIAGVTDRVHYAGQQAEVEPLLAEAEVVWVPSWRDAGVYVALEAMAASRPVVAARWPRLAEVIVDGQTGLLVKPQDQGGLARQTRLLLDDAALRQRMGEAGRSRVATCFSRTNSVDCSSRLYMKVVSGEW